MPALHYDAEYDNNSTDGTLSAKTKSTGFAKQTKQNAATLGEVVKLGLPEKSIGDFVDQKSARHKLEKNVQNYPPHKPYNVALHQVPVTVERLPYIPDEHTRLIDAGSARVNIAASAEAPHGTTQNRWAELHTDQTVRF